MLVGREREEEGQDKRDSDTLNDDTKTERETETAERMLLLTRALLYCETSMFTVFRHILAAYSTCPLRLRLFFKSRQLLNKEHEYARTKEREYKTELDQHQMTQEMLRGEIQLANTKLREELEGRSHDSQDVD